MPLRSGWPKPDPQIPEKRQSTISNLGRTRQVHRGSFDTENQCLQRIHTTSGANLLITDTAQLEGAEVVCSIVVWAGQADQQFNRAALRFEGP